MERKISSFMMWSHILIAYELLNTIFLGDYIFAFFGACTLIFSLLYHYNHETKWLLHDLVSSRATILYINYQSYIKFNYFQLMFIVALDLCTLAIYLYAQRYGKQHYERWHPWMHIIPTILGRYYTATCQYLALKEKIKNI